MPLGFENSNVMWALVATVCSASLPGLRTLCLQGGSGELRVLHTAVVESHYVVMVSPASPPRIDRALEGHHRATRAFGPRALSTEAGKLGSSSLSCFFAAIGLCTKCEVSRKNTESSRQSAILSNWNRTGSEPPAADQSAVHDNCGVLGLP